MSTETKINNPDETQAIQDCYSDEYSHCYGCGSLNEYGFKLKSYWDGDESVCYFSPESFYTGGKKTLVYGGLLACLVDCHGAATAAAVKLREHGIEMKKGIMPRFVTGSLKVSYLAPTPINTEIELRGRAKDISGRKVTIEIDIIANNQICAKGELLFIQLKDQIIID